MRPTECFPTDKREKYLESYLHDRLDVVCTRIRLTQLGAAQPEVHEAAGKLQLGRSFGMNCSLRVSRLGRAIADGISAFKRVDAAAVGQVVGEHNYYRLEAVDEDGAVWSHPSVTLSIRYSQDSYEVNFNGRFVENVAESGMAAYACRLTYLEELNLPMNLFVSETRPDGTVFMGRNGSAGRVSNLDLTYKKRYSVSGFQRSEIELYAADGKAPRHVDSRMIETLQFSAGLLVQPICTEVAHGKHRSILFVRHAPVRRGLVLPPLQGQAAEADYYRLATAFYEHSCLAGDQERLSPLFGKIVPVLEVGAASVAPIALLLCVAVEGLTQVEQLSGRLKASAGHKKVVREVLTAVLALPQLEELAQRYQEVNTGADKRTLQERLRAVIGLLSQGGRTKDALDLLEVAGAVTREEIRSWDNLRHASAHGSWELKEDRFQVDLNDMYTVLTLVYRMTFTQIRYRGLFTNRGKAHWPTESFDGEAAQTRLGFR